MDVNNFRLKYLEKVFQANEPKKQASVDILTPTKIDLKPK